MIIDVLQHNGTEKLWVKKLHHMERAILAIIIFHRTSLLDSVVEISGVSFEN